MSDSLLKKLCQEQPNEATTAIKTLCDDQGGLIEDRNHIIHGLWAIKWDKATGATTAACLYQKNKRVPIAAEKLEVLSDRAAKFSGHLGALLEKINPAFLIEDRPRKFFFGEGSPDGHEPLPWPPVEPQ